VPHNDNAGAVRFNLIGREPNGVVPAEHYEALSDELSAKLLGMRDASGDKPAVAKVVKIREMFSGPALDRLPDLMVVWNRDADLSSVSSPHFGEVRRKDILDRTGDHSTRGIVVSDRAFECSASGPISPMDVTPILLEAVQTAGAVRSATAP
jgi:predicted AlkP superfamily phosphohydrolase/phosphomutase